jgi:trans-2,3-dihydro-3-hydroxyanthranilate isomerase
MRYRYLVLDVFTAQSFTGNPLAVLPDAEGLDGVAMQKIAREFNLSETAFVLPAEDRQHLAAVRIFTPAAELGFAGHPTVGTAIALALEQRIPADAASFVLEEGAGPVPVTLTWANGLPVAAEFRAPQPVSLGSAFDIATFAGAIGLEPEQLVAPVAAPIVASCGTSLLFVTLDCCETLAGLQASRFAAIPNMREGVFLATRDVGAAGGALGADWRARVFAPQLGIAEDPATGSAAAAFAGLLATREAAQDGEFVLKIAQGIEMGRPSLIESRAVKERDEVKAIFVGGQAVKIAEGWIEAP